MMAGLHGEYVGFKKCLRIKEEFYRVGGFRVQGLGLRANLGLWFRAYIFL